MTEIAEPLAKFHVKVAQGRRFTLPEATRLRYDIEEGYYIEVIVRLIDKETKEIVGRGHFVPKVSRFGMITIPKGLCEKLGIEKGDVLEVLLIDYFSIHDILGERAKKLRNVLRHGFEVLDPLQERQLLMR